MNKKTIFIILTIILIIAGVGAGVYLVQQNAEIREKAAEPSTLISFTTDNQTPEVDQSFSVDVEIDTRDNIVTGLELYVNFDPQYLEVVNATESVFFEDQDKIGPNIDNDNGSIYLVLFSTTTAKQGQGKVATINFNAISPGTTSISVGDNTIVSSGESEQAYEFSQGPRNVLEGTSPLTVNIAQAASPTATPTPTTTVTLSPSPTPTGSDTGNNNDGLGGETTQTPTPTRTPSPTPTEGIGGFADTPTPTQAQSVGTPTPTPQMPEIPDSGVSLPTIGGIMLGLMVILGAIILAI